eukprot:Clim_evm10s245 gene=Clim_evmTU10s245
MVFGSKSTRRASTVEVKQPKMVDGPVPKMKESWLLATCAFIFFLPLGIASMVFLSQAKSAYKARNVTKAESKLYGAHLMSSVAILIGTILIAVIGLMVSEGLTNGGE